MGKINIKYREQPVVTRTAGYFCDYVIRISYNITIVLYFIEEGTNL